MNSEYGKRMAGLIAKLGIIIMVVFFSQVHPYVHFHHSHAVWAPPVDAVVWPTQEEPNHIHYGHDQGDSSNSGDDSHQHHPDSNQHIDWQVARAHVSNIIVATGPGHLVDTVVGLMVPSRCLHRSRTDGDPLPDSAVLEAPDPRGPPALG